MALVLFHKCSRLCYKGAAGFAPSGVGFAPSTAGYASYAAGYAPSAAGFTSSAAGYAPSAAGYAPSAAGYAQGAAGYGPKTKNKAKLSPAELDLGLSLEAFSRSVMIDVNA